VLTGYAGAPTVTHLGRLLGWEPPPLTVREARRFAPQTKLAGFSARGAANPANVVGGGGVSVTTRGLSVGHGSTAVLSGVDLELRAGEVVALLGRNGSGKTTLLRALAGLADPLAGRVERAGAVAYVPQDPGSMLFAPTVRAEVETTPRLLGRPDPAGVEHWLDALGLTPLADRHPRSLSSGQRQRLAIAAVAVGGAPALLLDEPTRGIDPTSRAALEAAVHAHAAAGGTVVIATHDVELAARCASRVVVLGDGDIVADGQARDVLAGSLFAPQVLRVLPPFLTVAEVEAALTLDGRR
jgi:energy-coupling factor transport system ATP-binding protein